MSASAECRHWSGRAVRLVKLRFIGRGQAHRAGPPQLGGYDVVAIATLIRTIQVRPVGLAGRPVAG